VQQDTIQLWTPQGVYPQDVALPPETIFHIQVNGEPLLNIAASPTRPESLAVGFLYYSGIIQHQEEIEVLHLSKEGTCIDIWLTHSLDEKTREPLLTSGCGRGVVLGGLYRPDTPLEDELRIHPERLITMMGTLQSNAHLYQQTRGVHSSALFSPAGELLALAEDIGRHNTLDKLLGLCLLEDLVSEGAILLSTGRISSEMVSKAARMRAPIVGSLTAITSLAATLAEEWGMTTVGYVRGRGMQICTHPWRIAPTGPNAAIRTPNPLACSR